MRQNKNWCSSHDVANSFNVSHDEAKIYIDVLRGRNVVIYKQTNEVKRINSNLEIEKEYVVNYPIEMIVPLIKEALKIS